MINKWRQFREKWNDDYAWRRKHWTLIHTVENVWDYTRIVFWTLLAVGVFLGLMWGLFYFTGQPPCEKFAQAFTGQYTYDVISGCFINVGDGRFLPAKNIIFVVGEGLKLLP